MEDELWLKKIKNRLEDYSEPVPAAGWEQLEKKMSATGKPMPVQHRMIPFRHWIVAASAVLLVAVSSVSLWLLQSHIGDEVRNTSASALAVLPDRLPEQVMPAMQTNPAEPVIRTNGKVPATPHAPRHSLVSQHINILTEGEGNKSETETLPIETRDETKNKERNESRHATEEQWQTERPTTENSDRKERYRPSGREKLHLPAKSKPASKSGSQGVGVGLFIGNMGGLSLTNGGDFQDAPFNSSISNNINLPSNANGIVVIPEGQELVFKNGLPYIQNRENRIADIDHKQPLSFGISVRKNLPKGFSVESGLTYTYLASDIRYEGSAVKTSQKLHYIGIPIRGNWNFVDTKNFTVYVSTGGAIEKCVYGKIGTEKETVKPVQLSVMGAVGAQYNISDRTGLYIEPGVSRFFDDGSSVQTIRKENPCSFTLQAGIRLTY